MGEDSTGHQMAVCVLTTGLLSVAKMAVELMQTQLLFLGVRDAMRLIVTSACESVCKCVWCSSKEEGAMDLRHGLEGD